LICKFRSCSFGVECYAAELDKRMYFSMGWPDRRALGLADVDGKPWVVPVYFNCRIGGLYVRPVSSTVPECIAVCQGELKKQIQHFRYILLVAKKSGLCTR